MGAGAEIGGQARAALAAIRLEFPGWHPFPTRPEIPGKRPRFWATRVGAARRAPEDPPPDWWAMTLDADTPGELRDAIVAQEKAGGG